MPTKRLRTARRNRHEWNQAQFPFHREVLEKPMLPHEKSKNLPRLTPAMAKAVWPGQRRPGARRKLPKLVNEKPTETAVLDGALAALIAATTDALRQQALAPNLPKG
jgi:hypothetical protein